MFNWKRWKRFGGGGVWMLLDKELEGETGVDNAKGGDRRLN